jgi:protein TIF31
MFVMEVVNEKKEEVELCSSVECKGIIGNDGRHYILDLLRYRSSSTFTIYG